MEKEGIKTIQRKKCQTLGGNEGLVFLGDGYIWHSLIEDKIKEGSKLSYHLRVSVK